jgi:hypothetical protein
MKKAEKRMKNSVSGFCLVAILSGFLTSCAPAKKADPTLQEYSKFLIDKIQGMSATTVAKGVINGCDGEARRSLRYSKVNISDQSVEIQEQDWMSWDFPKCNSLKTKPWIETVEFSYSELAVAALKNIESSIEVFEPPDKGLTIEKSMYGIRLEFRNPVKSTYKGKASMVKSWVVFMPDKKLAAEILDAFKHAAELSGASK